MKTIVLKPKLEVGETVMIYGDEWIYIDYSPGVRPQLEFRGAPGNKKAGFWLWQDEISIIESPAECSHKFESICVDKCSNKPCNHHKIQKCIKCGVDTPDSLGDMPCQDSHETYFPYDYQGSRISNPIMPPEIPEHSHHVDKRDIYSCKCGGKYPINKTKEGIAYLDDCDKCGHNCAWDEQPEIPSKDEISSFAKNRIATPHELVTDINEELFPTSYCHCDRADQSITIEFDKYTHVLRCKRCNRIYGMMADGSLELEEMRKENELLKEDIEYRMEYCNTLKNQYEELKESCKKPQGNPFKVGDKVKIYGFGTREDINEYFYFRGVESQVIRQDIETVTVIPFDDVNIYRFHYKQCELVE